MNGKCENVFVGMSLMSSLKTKKKKEELLERSLNRYDSYVIRNVYNL